MNSDIQIADTNIKPGTQITLDLPIPKLYTHTNITMPVHIIHGKREGPCLLVCAAIHGDELNGVEIIRRLMQQKNLKRIRGTLITIPVVNLYGVIHHSRYLPDRRDLNRSFPGSETGSLASRLANLIMKDIIANVTHAIDLHTGALHRSNVPQIRANIEDKETQELACKFGVPVVINAKLRNGSLRAAAGDYGVPILIYEAGEALRFDEVSIRVGVRGINNVMAALQMLPPKKCSKIAEKQFIAKSSSWTRAPSSGVLLNKTKLGATVNKGDVLGVVADPFGKTEIEITTAKSGVVIGRTHLPLVNEGDAVIHIAHFVDLPGVTDEVTEFHDNQQQEIEDDEMLPIV